MQNIFITGANGGIGRAIVDQLRMYDFHVFATARKSADIEELDALENVTCFELDITKPKEIQNLAEYFTDNHIEIHGIINNAGIADIGPIFNYSIEAVKDVFEVNLYGMIRVTNAFLPFLRKTKGRIILISSMSGILSGPQFGLYSMSKHAVEAYGDTLFFDLKDTGIHISLIEPGNYSSNMFKNYTQRLQHQSEQDHLFASTEERENFYKRLDRLQESEQKSGDPMEVAIAIKDALLSEKPKMRYMMGPQRETDWVLNRLIIDILQLNEYPSHTLSKQALLDRVAEKWDEFHSQNFDPYKY